ncbi:MAG TPA: hypothetical protein PK156_50605, partial [Polyangium sp.]|nr:hypothetical protein [Polyangium sp.]
RFRPIVIVIFVVLLVITSLSLTRPFVFILIVFIPPVPPSCSSLVVLIFDSRLSAGTVFGSRTITHPFRGVLGFAKRAFHNETEIACRDGQLRLAFRAGIDGDISRGSSRGRRIGNRK